MAVLLGTIDTSGVSGQEITLVPVGGAGSIETDENKVGNVVGKRNKNGVDNTDGEWDGIEITFTDANDDTLEHGYGYEVTGVTGDVITFVGALETGTAADASDGAKVWKTYDGAHNTEDQHNQLRLLGHI